MSAARVIQAAVRTALLGNPTYAGLVTGVFDMTPAKATAFPYTLVGDADEEGAHTHDKRGHMHTLTVHDWSEYDGTLQCLQILEQRNVVLHGATLTVAGYGLTKMLYEFGTVLVEWDDELKKYLRHQVSRYRLHSLGA